MIARLENEDGHEESMILVMGVTGAGKTQFIKTLVQDSELVEVVKPSSGLESATAECFAVRTKLRDDMTLAIVDTPGFNDTYKSDAQILNEITTFLTTQDQIGIPLKGIVYLHRITDNRMEGTARKHLEMFKKLCGDDALGNVVLLTTMWSNQANKSEGMGRERELREKWWNLMEEKGSTIRRWDDSREMAETIIALLLEKDSITLEIQRELRDTKKRLEDTAAGRVILPDLNDDDLEERKWLKAQVAEETRKKIKDKGSKFDFKDGLSIFATVLGVTVNILLNVLPLFGVAF